MITAGGVGGGRHDHVRAALGRMGVEEVMRGIMADPCRPVWLGRRDDQVVLGLPGNPVSAAVGFHVMGRELLGQREEWPRRAPLARDVPSHGDRVDLPRCAIGRDGRLEPMPQQGSHAITSPLRGGRARLDPRARGRRARGRARRVRAAAALGDGP